MKILQTATRPMSLGPGPTMEKIQAQVTISEDPTKFISETNSTHALVSTPLYGGSMCRRPSPLHHEFHMAPHCAISCCWSQSFAAATSAQP